MIHLSGPGPVFRLAGRLSGIRLPVPVRFSGWPAGYPVSGFRSRSGFPAGRPVIRYPASGPGPVFRLAGQLSGIRLPVQFSGWPAGYPVSGFRSRSGFPAGQPVIRYLASGPGPVFRLAGRLSGIRLPVPVRFSGWPAGYPVSGFRSRSGFPAGRPVIRYTASGPGRVFRLAGRLSGIRLPAPLTTTVRVLCWDNFFLMFPFVTLKHLSTFRIKESKGITENID